MNCPYCNKNISDTLIARHLASKGGYKSAEIMTKEQRIERAKKAVSARWQNRNQIGYMGTSGTDMEDHDF